MEKAKELGRKILVGISIFLVLIWSLIQKFGQWLKGLLKRLLQASKNIGRYIIKSLRVLGLIALLILWIWFLWTRRMYPQHIFSITVAGAFVFFFIVPKIWDAVTATWRGSWIGATQPLKVIVLIVLIIIAVPILFPEAIKLLEDPGAQTNWKETWNGFHLALLGMR